MSIASISGMKLLRFFIFFARASFVLIIGISITDGVKFPLQSVFIEKELLDIKFKIKLVLLLVIELVHDRRKLKQRDNRIELNGPLPSSSVYCF